MSCKEMRRLAWMATASWLMALTPSYAQDAARGGTPGEAPDVGLAEIVVTARKQAESLIDVPVAVTALGAADLQRYNANDLSRISQLAPQLLVARAPSGGGGTFNIRGIGSSPLEPGLDQSVSVNLDGVQLSRGRLVSQAMFDLAQVEVLKGPQALFFGKNSPAGVVSLTTAGPTDSFQASVTAGYEFVADERYVEAAVSGPITDTLKARVAVRGSEMSGFMRNVAPAIDDPLKPGLPAPGAHDRRQPRGHNLAGRLTLAYAPTSDFDAQLKLSYGRDRQNSMTASMEPFCLPGVGVTQYGVPDPYSDCAVNRRTAISDANPGITLNYPGSNGGRRYSNTDVFLTSLSMTRKLDGVTLASVTGYSRLTFHGFDNFSFSALPEVLAVNNEKTKSFSQELRATSDFAGPLNFTVGAYYEHVNRRDWALPMLFWVGPDPRGQQYSYRRDAFNRNEALSAFGQLRWNLLPNLELAGGVRWTRETKRLRIGNSYVNPFFSPAVIPLFPEGQFLNGRYRDTDWSPEATLTWHPTADSTLYAAYKTGYKSGGFANPLIFNASYTTDTFGYAAESAEGGEIGYKAQFFDRRARLELAAYRYTFSNLQLSSFDAASFSYFVRNAGRARTEGVEANAEWRARPELVLRAGAAYNRARYLRFPTAQCYQTQTWRQGCVNPAAGTPADLDTTGGVQQDLAGRPLQRAPRFVGNFGASYDAPLGGALMIGLDADARYSSGYYVDEALTPFTRQEGFWLLNAAVRLYAPDRRWEVALIGRNLTNELWTNLVQDLPGGSPGSWALQIERPREIAVQVRARF